MPVEEPARGIRVGEEERDEAPHHEDLAVREVDHAQDAVHEGVPDRDQGVDAALCHTRDHERFPRGRVVALARGQGQRLVGADRDERDDEDRQPDLDQLAQREPLHATDGGGRRTRRRLDVGVLSHRVSPGCASRGEPCSPRDAQLGSSLSPSPSPARASSFRRRRAGRSRSSPRWPGWAPRTPRS